MAVDTLEAKQHAHELVDRLGPAQLDAVVRLLNVMLDSVTQASEAEELEDEDISEEEEVAVARSKAWFQQNEGIPFEQVVAELGFTMQQIRSHKDSEA